MKPPTIAQDRVIYKLWTRTGLDPKEIADKLRISIHRVRHSLRRHRLRIKDLNPYSRGVRLSYVR